MSALVPTRITSVTVPCPGWADARECRAPLDVDVEIIGRHLPATRWTPAETPEVYALTVLTGCDVCETVFDRVDRDRIREQAERKGAEVAHAA